MTAKRYAHPEYLRKVENWRTLYDLYEGDQSIMRQTKYLPKFNVENGSDDVRKKLYQQRLQRTFYTNLCEPIVWIWIGWLFQDEIKTDQIGKIITEEEQANIDGQGTSLVDFIQELARVLILFGPTYAVIDTPNSQAKTLFEQQEMGIRPYGQIIEPLFVPDWIVKNVDYSPSGEYQMIDYIWRAVGKREGGSDKPSEYWYRRSLSLDDSGVNSELFIQKATDIQSNTEKTAAEQFDPYQQETTWESKDSKDMALERLPIVTGGKKSWILACASNMLKRHQLESSHENILHSHAYPKIFISGKPLGGTGEKLEFSENSVNFLEAGSSVLTVAETNASALDLKIKDTTDTIFKIALNQIRTLPGTSQAVQSDRTIREERAPQFAAAKSAVKEFETLINGIVQVWADYKGHDVKENEKVTLNREFGKEDAEAIERRFMTYGNYINKYSEWLKAHLSKAVDREGFDDTTTKKIKEQFLDETGSGGNSAADNVRNQLLEQIANGSQENSDNPQS